MWLKALQAASRPLGAKSTTYSFHPFTVSGLGSMLDPTTGIDLCKPKRETRWRWQRVLLVQPRFPTFAVTLRGLKWFVKAAAESLGANKSQRSGRERA